MISVARTSSSLHLRHFEWMWQFQFTDNSVFSRSLSGWCSSLGFKRACARAHTKTHACAHTRTLQRNLPGESSWISLLQCRRPPPPPPPPYPSLLWKSPWGLWACVCVRVGVCFCVYDSVCFSVHATSFLEGDGLSDAWVGGWFPQLHRSLQSNFPLMLSALLDIS